MVGNAAKTAALHGFEPDRPHATCLPLYHVNALMMSLLGTRIARAPLTVCERFDPVEYFDAIARAGARTASIVPTLLHRLVQARPPWPDCLDYLITAAAPLERELAEAFQRAYGPRLRQGYGLSEAVNFSCTMPLLDSAEFRDQYVARQPPVGVALPGTQVRIDDGEVLIRTDDVMRGYWQDPAASARAIDPDGWLHTGDLGEMRDDFLVLTGRRKELINRGGEKHSPREIERRWRSAGLAGWSVAVSVRSPELGEDIGLVTDSGSVAGTRILAEQHAFAPLSARSEGMLLTSTGKSRRAEMSRRLIGRHDGTVRYADLLAYARNAAEAIVAHPSPPTTALSSRLRAHARDLAALADGRRSGGRSAAHDALDALVEHWPSLADGSATGEDVMRARRGLWQRLMVEWPMGSYAELIADVLTANGWLRGRVLELGSGVGNTTRLVADAVDGEFVRSDLSPDLIRRGDWPGRGVVYDFDRPPPPELFGFDTVFATNAVHCAADKARTLAWVRGMLVPGGLRAGRHDLGGIVWGFRRDA